MSKVRLINKWDEYQARVETGNVQFGDDWPGVFIRGDNAMYFAYNLRHVLGAMKEQIEKDPMMIISAATVSNLIEILESCNVHTMKKDE